MTDDELLQLYLDGELTSEQARAFRARLQASPELQRELTELQVVGGLVRRWAEDSGARAADLVTPTLAKIDTAATLRSRHASLGMAVAAVMLVLLPAAGNEPSRLPGSLMAAPPSAVLAPPAAIERLEAGDRHAQVFVVGEASTPVVWLADEGADEPASEQDPG